VPVEKAEGVPVKAQRRKRRQRKRKTKRERPRGRQTTLAHRRASHRSMGLEAVRIMKK